MLSKVLNMANNGWFPSKKNCDANVVKYWKML